MLTALRKSANTLVVRILLFLFIASFSLWGVASYLAPNLTGSYAASVAGENIPMTEFERRLRNYRQRMQMLTGRSYEEGTPEAKESAKAVLDGMVAEKLLDLRSRELGVMVGESSLTRDVSASPYFRDDKGAFSEERFLAALNNAGMSKREYFAGRRDDIRSELLRRSFSFTPDFPEKVMTRVHDYRFQERQADMLFVPYASVQVAGEPAETELQQLWQDNAKLFRAPEYRDIAYVEITPEDAAKSIPAGDDVLKPFFESRPEAYNLPEMRELIQYRFDDEASAQAAMEQIFKGGPGSFAKDPTGEKDPLKDRREEAGRFAQEELPETLRKRVFAAKEFTYTGPLQSPFGWHVVYVAKVIAAHKGGFDEVKDKVKADYLRKETDAKYPDFLHEVEDKLAEGADVKTLSDKFGLTLQRFTVDASGKTSSGEQTDLAEIGLKPLLEAAFASKEKNIASAPVPVGDGGTQYAVFSVSSVTPGHVKALDEVRGKAAELWKKQRRKQALEAEAKALAADAKDGEAFIEALSAKYPSAVRQKSLGVRRTLAEGGLPQTEENVNDDVAKAAFAAAKGAPAYALNDDREILAAFSVTGEKTGKDAAGPEMITAVRDEWRRGFADDFFEQYLRHLKRVYKVRYNPDLM